MTNGFKWPGGRNPDDPPRDFLERLLTDPRILLWGVIFLIAIWLGSGFYVVDPGETGVIRRFGKELAKTSPGLNYHLPWPIDQRNIVNTERIRRIEVGFRSGAGTLDRERKATAESLMLTGDENIVDAQMIVQYKVGDPSKFLFRLRNPEETLHVAAQVALRSIVGQATIDDVLTVGRTRVQAETQLFFQRLMDNYQSGIAITEVKLQVVDPPEQVKDAFHEVVRAREDRERLINQALGYKEDLIPRARGEAQKVLRDAEAYKEERILKSKGDGARFLALYEEYKKATKVTRDRLYLETVNRILPKADKIIVDPAIHTTILPLMPLGLNVLPDSKPAPSSDSQSGIESQLATQPFRQVRR